MRELPPDAAPEAERGLADQLDAKARRKLMARQAGTPGVWFGLGMIGLIGWSVVVPTLIGAATGIWLDRHYAVDHSWALALLFVGLALGCFNAWHWMTREEQAIRDSAENDRE